MRKLIFLSIILFSGCVKKFDTNIATEDFYRENQKCEVISIKNYECDGTLGECWYVEFKYKCDSSNTEQHITYQYFLKEDYWTLQNIF